MAKNGGSGRGANLEPYRFKEGVSGNLSGKSKRYEEVRSLARAHSRQAIERLVELVNSRDERVALMAAKEILDRAYGRPKPTEDCESTDNRLVINIVRYSDADEPEPLQAVEVPSIEPGQFHEVGVGHPAAASSDDAAT